MKLNALIARNRGVQEDLQSTNVLMQNEFTRQLKAEERETVQLQTQIEDLHNERERLLNAVIEAERQLLLWEKKIQLVKVCVCVCVCARARVCVFMRVFTCACVCRVCVFVG